MKIEEIKNDTLLEKIKQNYEEKKTLPEDVISKLTMKATPKTDGPVISLFHGTGTSNTNPEVIFGSEDGFDPSKSNSCIFGPGCYFSANFVYSKGKYSYEVDTYRRSMLICDVIVGKPKSKNSTNETPDLRCWDEGETKKTISLKCEECNGKGKKGFFRRKCKTCEGKGSIESTNRVPIAPAYNSIHYSSDNSNSDMYVVFQKYQVYPRYLITYTHWDQYRGRGAFLDLTTDRPARGDWA